MFRRCALRGCASGTSHRPYQQVLRSIEQSDGLLSALNVFRQFEKFYKSRSVLSVAVGKPGAATTKSIQTVSKPLTEFCGNANEVEPFTIVLLKVLCDLQKLEEMRFLFMQCVLELEEQRISSELFNVYLLAISMTDTFNQNEVENVVDLMKVKEIVPDIVTKISLFILYLRLGIEESNLWWPIIRKEVVELQEDVGKYPLLQLRLLHCFQTLVRLHHNTEIMDQCFSLVKLIAPRYLNQRNLVPYIMLGISNAASSPSALVEAVKCADDFKGDTPGKSRKEDHEPLLHNEVTLFRLLAKCCASGSLSDVDYLIQYAAFYEKHEIVAAANLPVIGLLHVYALVRSGALQDALRELDQLPPSYCTTGRKVHMTSKTGKTIIILNKDVIQTCVVALAAGGAEGVLRQLALMKEKPVSGNSLNVIMAALAHYHDYHAAEQLLGYYAESGVPISTFTLRSLLLSYQDVEPALGVTRAQSVLLALPKWGVPLEVELLNTILHLALEAGDVQSARLFLDRYVDVQSPVPPHLSTALFHKYLAGLDQEGISGTLKILQKTKSVVDPAVLEKCTSEMTRWNLKGEKLTK